MDYLLRDRFTLGGDATAAAGPYGRQAAAMTDLQFKASILSWSRSRGVFAGVALDGAVLKQDRDDNRRLYGRRVEARAILLPEEGKAIAPPEAVSAWMNALATDVPPKK